MNPAAPPPANKTAARSSGYHRKALAEIRNSLLPFANGSDREGGSSAASTVSSGVSSASGDYGLLRTSLSQLLAQGYEEVPPEVDAAVPQARSQPCFQDAALRALKYVGGRYDAALDVLSKPDPRKGPTLSTLSSLGSLGPLSALGHRPDPRRGSPAPDSGAGSSRSDSPRPPDSHDKLARQYSPSGFGDAPPPPPPRCASTPPPPPHPVHQLLRRMSPAPPARGAQQLSQQMQALSVRPASEGPEPPPPYPCQPPPPSYSASMQSRRSPTRSPHDRRPQPVARPTPLTAWGARQAKTQPPVIMQSVKSTQVQKPVLQTAVAPAAPQPAPAAPPPPPSYASSVQQRQRAQSPPRPVAPKPPSPSAATPPVVQPPSYATTMQALAAQRAARPQPPPPPPYGDREDAARPRPVRREGAAPSPEEPEPRRRCARPRPPSDASPSTGEGDPPEQRHEPPPCKKIRHHSPIPERKHMSKEKEDERRDSKVKNYSPQAFKFFMEQHVENVIKSYRQRLFRKMQLEKEMNKIGLSPEAQCQMRKMLSQKESNYIRLKRAKMDKSMFTKIQAIGVGAFGEVTLVRKIDTRHLYAMKTLRKADVLKRNQVAHVKAERDILAEADNEWVVKLYYSFQDRDNLYFVMDYIPGGDLMSLLIKLGIFEETLARFYVAELTCAVESVHRMGFIHRDIKPDNILIDRDGHIKLTDFGLCTGFRWTHNSKYYQRNGEHGRQDSVEPDGDWREGECRCRQLKPLERRRRQEHQRCLAHSLVGTPNYIAPEVLQRTGYTQLCDWWSVGVILYEMLVGSPPFLAGTPAETQYKVINWETTLHIPKAANLSRESTDLILKLCSGAETRLGKDAAEVKNHPFFKKIDFEKGLRSQQAPHIPRIEFPTDTSNFDPIDPDKLRNSGNSDSNKSDNELLDNGKTFHGFFEFTFRRFFVDGGPEYSNRISLDDYENQGPVYV